MKAGTTRRRESERRERIDRILRAARSVFLEKGYHGAAVRDIAAESDLSTGAIYFYFKGKDDIYGRLCEEVMHLTLYELKKALQPDASTVERLNGIVSAYVGFYVQYRDDFDLLETGFKQVVLPEATSRRLDQLVVESLSIVNRIFEDAVGRGEIEAGTNTWELTMSLWAAFEGVIYIHKREFLMLGDIDLEQMVRVQLGIFLKGIGLGDHAA